MRSLDRCEVCGLGRMMTYKTKTMGAARKKYLKCDHCGENDSEPCGADDLGRSILKARTRSGIGQSGHGDNPS